MKIDIDDEQWEFLHRICVRAKMFNAAGFLKDVSSIDREKDMNKKDSLIHKLEKAKDGTL
jgi:hypothetical protein